MKKTINRHPGAQNQAELNQPLFKFALKHSLLIIIILILLSIAGAWLVVDRTDQAMRDEILVQAKMVARAINLARVSSLTGSTEDLASEDYRRLKEQLDAIKQALEISRRISESCEGEFIEDLPVSIALGGAARVSTTVSLYGVLKKAEDILSHHECFDGKGYPRGLQGEAIPLLARITSIADAFEVMNNGRPYKKAMPQSDILKEFKRCSGTQFDPAVVDILFKIL